ncbi:hypothetical protein MIMGU_mgv1a0177173mg, partial [Erythranthe guttata]
VQLVRIQLRVPEY